MNRQLAAALITTFRKDSYAHLQIATFGIRVWRRNLRWLDATGLALYFLDRLKSYGVEDAVPLEVITGLERRLADNKQRTVSLFDEFLRINGAFQNAGLRYVNLKGFTLVPDYCPDPSLRCQFDLDFLASSADTPRCRDILERFGYVMTGHGENVLEFKADSAQVPSIHDLYKVKPQRSVEVHFVPSAHTAAGFESGLLARSQSHTWSGTRFPALSDADMFMSQALHLFRHVKSEWTRISWLLEFKTCVTARRSDAQFWNDVRMRATAVVDGALAVGVTTWLATEAFGQFAPRELTNWSVEAIPHPVRLWLERYGTEVLLADFPGTKLYLLLNSELLSERSRGNIATLRKVFPLHRPPLVTTTVGRGAGRKVRAALAQLSYAMFRLRFHIVESFRYLLEARRWKRVMSASGWNADRVWSPRVGRVSAGSAAEN